MFSSGHKSLHGVINSRRWFTVLSVGSLLLTGLTFVPGLSSNASSTYTTTFATPNTSNTFTVPAGVTELTVEIVGGAGGTGGDDGAGDQVAAGQYVGRVTGTITVSPGQALGVYVGAGGGAGASGTGTGGGAGGLNPLSGFDGGAGGHAGNSGSSGGGGGGGAASVLLIDSFQAVAGGGAGSGGANNIANTTTTTGFQTPKAADQQISGTSGGPGTFPSGFDGGGGGGGGGGATGGEGGPSQKYNSSTETYGYGGYAGTSQAPTGFTADTITRTASQSGYIKFTYANLYLLTLDNEGSTADQYVVVGSSPTSPSLSRDGYTLSGWSDSDDETADYAANLNDYAMAAANDTLFAVWAANTNGVTWDSNGGSSVSSSSFATGGTLSNPTDPTKTDMIFGGWSTSESSDQGSIAHRITSWPYSPTATSDITLYAIWLSVAPPQSVSATSANQSLLVQWTAPSTAATEIPTGYQVEYSTTGTATGTWNVSSSSIDANATSHTITGLTNGTSYYVRVVALYNGAKGAYGYPWTKVFETTTKNRVSGQIFYTDGFGLSGRSSLLSRSDFSRVRYELRAAYTSGGTQFYVDSNFDATLTNNNTQDSPASPGYTNLYRLQVPVPTGGTNSQFVIHGNIADLSVESNVDAVTQGVGQTGRLEIWPWDYDTAAAPGLSGGSPSGSTYDSGDNPTGGNIYGSFQLHTFINGGAETAFAWNRHYDSNPDPVEIGFGNNTSHGIHPDWTFAGNPGNGMSSRSNFVFRSYANIPVAPAPDTYTITFNFNGADGGERPANDDYTVGGTAIELPAPTKSDGTLFGGWYSNSGLTNFVGYAGDDYSPSATGNLYAAWTNLLINLDGSNSSSLANDGSTWTSVTPGAADDVGTALDGATYFGSDGQIEGFEFDGDEDAIQFAKGVGTVTDALTVETWIQPSSLRDGWNIFATKWFSTAGTITTNVGLDWHFAIRKEGTNNARLNLFTSENGTSISGNNLYGSYVFPVTSTDWYLVGFTLDADGNLQFYVNGSPDGDVHENVPHAPATGSYLWLGDAREGIGFTGKMSEFRIYNKALTAAEIQTGFKAKADTYGLSNIDFQAGDFGTGSTVSGFKYDGDGFGLPNSATANNYFTRTGHTVTGWNTDSDGSSGTGWNLDATYSTNENITLYPVWTADTYTVTYAAGVYSSGLSQTATKTHGVDLTLVNKATATGYFERQSHEITGWNTNPDGESGTDYAFGSSYSLEQDITLYPVWESTALEATHDTWVQSGSYSNSVYGSNASLLFKNAANSTSNGYNRVVYSSFSYDSAFNWSGAALEVYVSGNSDGSVNNGYNNSYTSFNVDIFGMADASWDESSLTFNLANSSTQDWGLNTVTWPWNPDSGTYLGTISIPTSSSTIGQKFALSNSALDSFLNADSDGEVTFYMRRSDVDNQANLAFASSENTSYPGPSLVVAGSGYAYTVAYDINGGTGTLPPAGTFSEGGDAYEIAATTGITAPANKTLSGWNTKKDGTGTNYSAGDSYDTAASLTLYAKYVDYPKVTFKSNYSGGPSDIQQIVTPSTDTALRQNSFTRTGYTFAGWDTVALGGGTDYADEATINISAGDDLFAQWTANQYTVMYDYRGSDGGESDVSDTYTVDSGSPITLPVPTKTGHTFAGWFESATYAGDAEGSTYEASQNITLTAKWTALDYTLAYNDTGADGGSVPTDSTQYNYLQSATISANNGGLYKTGYSFAGWVTNSDGSGTPKNAGESIQFAAAENIELYPQWAPETYTITYSANGATLGSLAKASDSYTTDQEAGITLPGGGTLAKAGYSFGNWSTQSSNGSAIVGAYTTNQDVTLYAIWTPVDYEFSYDFNGGTGTALSNQSANIEETVTVRGIGDAVKDGNWFSGWNTESDGSGDNYAAGNTARIPIDGETLYAIWVPNEYQISYNANGGSGGPELVGGYDIATDGVEYTIRNKGTLARTGYSFSHWTTSAVGTGSKYDSATNADGELATFIPSGNTVFYAQWTPISYSLAFARDGGNNSSLVNQTKTIGQTLEMPSPGTKTGYTFDSWTDGTNEYSVGSTYVVGSASVAFTAQWTANVYTVTYDWQGGALKSGESAKVSDTYTVGSGSMNLSTGSTYFKDGYNFSGWSTSSSGSTITDFEPTANDVLYAIWEDGNYTLTYDAVGGDAGSANGTVARGGSVTLPTPVRDGFVFTGWFDAEEGGNKLGDGGASFTPSGTSTLYANWIQRSLFGVDLANLESAATLTIGSSGEGRSTTINSSGKPTASVVIPDQSLPAGTVVTARYFKDLQRQADLIEGDNNYIFSLLVSWISGDGSTATVPDTDPEKPIVVTLTSDAIKRGQSIYQVIGTEVTLLGKATDNGSVEVELFEDPEIVVAATVPDAPTGVSATAGGSGATVSWTAPVSNGGTAITGYTVTATPGGSTCTTTGETSCFVPDLLDGTSYTFSVIATNSVGDSSDSSSSSSISPLAPSYSLIFDSNGGSSVASGTFQTGGTVASPTNPTRTGFTFGGWSTIINDESTAVSFPFSPAGDSDVTLYALWTEVTETQNGSSGTSTANPTPTPTPAPTPTDGVPPSKIGFVPGAPSAPVAETGPVGSESGSADQIAFRADEARDNLIATGSGWELQVSALVAESAAESITENLELTFTVASKARISGTGLRPRSFAEVWVLSDPTYLGTVEIGADGSLATELALPPTLLPGEHTLQIGTLNSSGQLITLSIPITIKGKVTVGTFKGYIAIYTKDLDGQKLSAKVAGKWAIQDPIRNFKNYSFSRLVRFTGAGYDIVVDVYLNRKFYTRTTTRTR